MSRELSQIPAPQAPRPFNFPRFERFHLRNGLEVWYVRHEKLPLLSLQLVIMSGALHDPAGLEGTATFLADMLEEGTEEHDAETFTLLLENKGIQFGASADFNGSYLSMNTLSDHAPEALRLLAAALITPRFAEEDMERLRKIRVGHRRRMADMPDKVAAQVLAREIYPGHRYRLPAMGRLEQNSRLTLDELRAFYKKHYTPGNATLVVVGDLPREEITVLLEETLGPWRESGRRFELPPVSRTPENFQLHLVHRPGAQQAEIRLGHGGIDRHEADYFSALLANEILGGYFLSRLNMNLREEKGLTYGVDSRFALRRVPGPFYISAAVDSDKVTLALEEILKEVERMTREKVSTEELENARGYLSGVFPIAFETGAQIAAGLSNIALFDLEDDYYRNFRKQLERVTEDDVFNTARRRFKPQQMQVVVVADKEQVAASLEKKYPLKIHEIDVA